MEKYKNLNLKYALVNAAYLMLVCATSGYAYNFLSQSGFADGTVGTVITAISICGLFAQTAFGQIIDKSEKLDEKTFISMTMLVAIALSVLLIFMPKGSIVTILVVIVCFMSSAAGMPFLNSMAFIYEKDGAKINYGLGRGIGSGAYAVGSSLLGQLWAIGGREVLPIYVAVFATLTLLLVRLMPTPSKTAEETEHTEEKTESLSYVQFFQKYKLVIIPVLAMILMYFCHMLINTYVAKVIENIIGAEAASVSGAVEGYQGTALFIQAMCELPTMFAFAWLIKKFSINRLLVFCSIMYSVKHIMILLCPNIPMFYATMVIQMFSYAILVPGGVYLANELVAPEDRNKGQAIIGVTATIGGLLASFVGGQLFQVMSVTSVLFVGAVATVIGTVLMIIGIAAIKKNPASAE